jgi:hypothetical protein
MVVVLFLVRMSLAGRRTPTARQVSGGGPPPQLPQDSGQPREFLAHPTRPVFEWPIAQAKRQHVHHRIDDAELPVRHQTRRRGSPYTLVLTKTDELFTREQDARRQDEADLAWLTASGMHA